MGKCKFCGKEVEKTSLGYCISCYQYFVLHGFDTWYPSQYGSLSFVQDKNSKQYSMPICHICGRAYTKLQQHIYYSHHMTKAEYCDKFGLDRKIQMTTQPYHEKMREYAFMYEMDKQVKNAGKNTRFEKGHKSNFERSYQTKQRLHELGKVLGKKYGGAYKNDNVEE